MKVELIGNVGSVEFAINVQERICYVNGNPTILSEETLHPLINVETLTNLVNTDLRRENENKFNQEFSEFVRILSVAYLSSHVVVRYLMDTTQSYPKSIIISLEEIYDKNVKFRVKHNSRVSCHCECLVRDYNWLAGIKITDGHNRYRRWEFFTTKPELISYVLSHFRLGKMTLVKCNKYKRLIFEVKVYVNKDLAVQLIRHCKKVLKGSSNDSNITVTNSDNIVDIAHKVRYSVYEHLEPLLEKYLPSRVDQVLVLSAILAGDGVKHNKGLRVLYSLLRRLKDREHAFYVKEFVIDSILMYLNRNGIIRLNKYYLGVREGRHEGQVYISLNPEIAPLIPLFVPYSRGLSYMDLSFSNCVWSMKTAYDWSVYEKMHDAYVVSELRKVIGFIEYGYVAYKGCSGHYYLVLKIRRDFIDRVVECLRGLGFNPQVYRSRSNEIRVYRGKEVLAKLLLECGKLHNVDEYRGVLEEWFRRLG